MNSKKPDRRGFLRRSAAVAGLAVGSMPFVNGKAIASVTPDLIDSDESSPKRGITPDEPNIEDLAYGGRSRFENSVRSALMGSGGATGLRNLTPLQDSIGIITPPSLHFVVSRDLHMPDIDPRDHTLMIHGLVDRPLVFTMEELKRFPSVSRVHFLECTGNSSVYQYKSMLKDLKKTKSPELSKSTYVIQQVHGRASTSEWTGVPLSLLLKEAGVQKGAVWMIAEGNDVGKHSKSIPVAKGWDDVLVAYGQNGEALRREQGYPLRLLVPGWQGVNNVKFLRSIKLVDKPYYVRPEISQYTNLRPDGKSSWYGYQIGPKSLITFPSDAHHLPEPGFYQISGLAWCGRGAVRRVEVSTDNGNTWSDAQLQQPIFRKAFTRFRMDWNWDGSPAVIMSRCTNEYGDIQPTLMEIAQLWGDSAEPHLPADEVVKFWETADVLEFFNNPIQPWRIERDGSVKDALYSTLNIKI